ncbi:MAG: SUF system Fe-S cluster assembly regulator [Zetaproteobacteria bacterium]|nr:MAG: SUF system Fe-S cluster assembly regulator [Zetaproteobacteria bacterium]
MIKITRMTDYAVVVLVALGATETLSSVSSLAQSTRLAEPTISKVLKALVRAKIVLSVRGSNGGYSLASKPEDISVESVINAIDGPIAITNCSDGYELDCSFENICSVVGRWDDVNTAIRSVLQNVTLADMAGNERDHRNYGSH